MPHPSKFASFNLSETDLWSFIFDRKTEFPDNHVIYQDAIDSSRIYTFSDVRETSKAFAAALHSHYNLAKGDVISVFTENDVDVGPLTYGALYAGCIVSPANPAYSVEEFAYMLKDAGAKAVITQADLLPSARQAAALAGIPDNKIILLGAKRISEGAPLHFEKVLNSNASMQRVTIDPVKDLAFLVYSSGTTGLPKGVMLNHKNVVADILMINFSVGDAYNWEADRLLGVLPFFHIYGLTGLLHQSLHRGIRLLVMPKFDMEVFCRTIQQYRITFAYIAPPVLVQLSRSDEAKKYDLSSLRMLTSGAAPLTRELVDDIHQKFKIKVNQAYGLSETSPMTHTQPWSEWYSSVGSVGKLFPNMLVKFVDLDGEEVETGTTGEMLLKGPNVFQGYWLRLEETKNTITPDGFLRTGDLGYIDKDGNCFITDRLKELIKYNGFQVAPAELEGLLIANPSVNDAAVIGIHDAQAHTELPRAYVVAAPGVARDEQSAQEIADWLNSKVVYYKKLRGGVRFVDQIPKSAAGKILRRVLRDAAKVEDEKDASRVKAKL